jgi:hypothetical protein
MDIHGEVYPAPLQNTVRRAPEPRIRIPEPEAILFELN